MMGIEGYGTAEKPIQINDQSLPIYLTYLDATKWWETWRISDMVKGTGKIKTVLTRLFFQRGHSKPILYLARKSPKVKS